jgi:ribosomal protein S18 acetylase RimI-like enzyme
MEIDESQNSDKDPFGSSSKNSGSNPFGSSMGDMKSFNEADFEVGNLVNEEVKPMPELNLRIPMKFSYTSFITYKNFQTLRNHFLLLFKVNYPEEFFRKIYLKQYFTIFALDSSNKEIAAFSVIEIINKKCQAVILALGVVKEFQGKGLGSVILQKSLEELTCCGVQQVDLIVQKINDTAIKLYQKFGFIIKEELLNYYTFDNREDNDALLMTNILINKKGKVTNLFRRITAKKLKNQEGKENIENTTEGKKNGA